MKILKRTNEKKFVDYYVLYILQTNISINQIVIKFIYNMKTSWKDMYKVRLLILVLFKVFLLILFTQNIFSINIESCNSNLQSGTYVLTKDLNDVQSSCF